MKRSDVSEYKLDAISKSLLVIIPALNEGGSITRVISEVRGCAEQLAKLSIDLHICVIDDGSTDDTVDLILQAGVDKVIINNRNLGCGAAVRSGLIYGRDNGFDIVVKLDADGQHNPSDIPALIHPILQGSADIVYGNRFPGLTYRMPFIRRVGNMFFRVIMRWLTNWDIKDSQPGIFAVNASYLKVSFIPGDYNYTQQVLLDSYLKGMKFEQVPVTFRRRESGSSFVSLVYPFKTIPQILMVLVSIKPLKVFMPMAAIFIIAAICIFLTELAMWFSGNAAKPVEHVNLLLGLGMFGLNTGFFGLLAELVVRRP